MEEKIVLKTVGDTGLYLFIRDNKAEFVVAYNNKDNLKIGDYVESWTSGHYFRKLDDAVEYFNERTKRYVQG